MGAVAASCGGDDEESAECSDRVSGDSAVELGFRVEPPSARDETSRALCARLTRLDLDAVRIRPSGRDLLVVRVDEDDAEAVRAATSTGTIAFYDWEPNVLGRGPDRPYAGGKALFRAVEAASGSKPRAEATDRGSDRRNDTAPARYYLFDSAERPIDQASRTRPADPPAGSRVIRVPRGILVVEAERGPNQPSTVPRYYVLEDDAELTGADIEDPEQSVDPRTNQPIVAFDFTARGRRAFARLTRRIAERSSRQIAPPDAPPAQAQRFAITLDDRVVSLATVDFVANPEGIDSPGAQIQGIGSVAETRAVARQLQAGPLPARLVQVSVRR
jgi:SecD/SecF fusion protein